MADFRPPSFRILPPVTKNLLILNVILFIGYNVCLNSFNIDLNDKLGLHYPGSEKFHVFQFITYIFMHGNIMHILFNMFGLFMFGSVLEQYWGPKRFLNYYFFCGIGAAIVHYVIYYFQLKPLLALPLSDQDRTDLLNMPVVVGASGSLFGLLTAFGVLFPNTLLMLIFFPVPIKAKYFVIGYGLIELFSGIRNASDDNVAHYAHLGGMLFGFVLLFIWKQRDRNKYLH